MLTQTAPSNQRQQTPHAFLLTAKSPGALLSATREQFSFFFKTAKL